MGRWVGLPKTISFGLTFVDSWTDDLYAIIKRVFAVKGTGSPGEGISIAVRSAGSMLHFEFVL